MTQRPEDAMTETNPATYANAVPLHPNPWIVTAASDRHSFFAPHADVKTRAATRSNYPAGESHSR